LDRSSRFTALLFVRQVKLFRDSSRRRRQLVDRLISPGAEGRWQLCVKEDHGTGRLGIEPHVAARRHRVRVGPVRVVKLVAKENPIPHEHEFGRRATVRVDAPLGERADHTVARPLHPLRADVEMVAIDERSAQVAAIVVDYRPPINSADIIVSAEARATSSSTSSWHRTHMPPNCAPT